MCTHACVIVLRYTLFGSDFDIISCMSQATNIAGLTMVIIFLLITFLLLICFK